jgi:hypothetical protein
LLLVFGGVVDKPDWVSWRWVVGLGGALTVIGAWLFGFGDLGGPEESGHGMRSDSMLLASPKWR